MLLADAFDPKSFQVLLAVAGVTTLLLARNAMARRKRALEPRAPLVLQHRTTGERSEPSTQDVQRMLVEMHEFARDVQAQLDNRLMMLQQLIHTADERIARLETLEASLAEEPASAPGEYLPTPPSDN